MSVENTRKTAYDAVDDMMKVKSVQKKFRDGFPGTTLDSSKWDNVVAAGGSIAVGGSVVTLGAGTAVNGETYILSKEYFTVPFRASIGLTMSQRIANQSFLVEAVSIDPVTLVPDGKHVAALLFDGTTVTQGKYRVQSNGQAPLDSAAQTFPTTASGSMYEIELFADEAWFHGGTLDATSARANSYRRHQQIPDPNALYKIRIRWLNGGTAPASTSTAAVQYIAVQDYAELTAEITAGRGQTIAGQAIGVYLTGGATQPVSGTVTANVAGQTAHGTAVTGNPARVGARAVNANYAAVATGAAADLISTLIGALVVKPYSIPEADWSFVVAAPITTAVDTALKAAGAAGIKNYLVGLQLINTGAAASEVTVKDGATVIWRTVLPANMSAPVSFDFNVPIKGAAATILNFGVTTAGANVYCSAQGYQAP